MKAADQDQIRWYCLKSQPKHEHIAAAHLRKIPGLEVFAPQLRFQKATTVGVRWYQEAMFPGYLFAKFPFIERHKEVRYTSGVQGIVQFGDYYASLDDQIIETLRERTDAKQIAVIETNLREGDEVKIVEGALRGLEAVVTSVLPRKERVQILVNFLGREMQAEVRSPQVLPARKHPLASDE